jgi:hypothetical protein
MVNSELNRRQGAPLITPTDLGSESAQDIACVMNAMRTGNMGQKHSTGPGDD